MSTRITLARQPAGDLVILLFYGLVSREHTSSITTIDQFGLNKLEVRSNKWLCVPAQIFERTSAER